MVAGWSTRETRETTFVTLPSPRAKSRQLCGLLLFRQAARYHSGEFGLSSRVWEHTAVCPAQGTRRGAGEGEADTDFFPISLLCKALIHQPKTHGPPARRLVHMGRLLPGTPKTSHKTEGDFKVNQCPERPKCNSARPVRRRRTQQSLRKCLL